MEPNLAPVVTFVGKSGTGKTTFLEKLIPELKRRGLRVAVLKHDAHEFEMDKPGKDTYRFTAAGADVVTISNAGKFAMVERPSRELEVRDIISRLPQVDLVLTEGYKKSRYPKIEIHRAELKCPLIAEEAELLAVMTDEPLDTGARQLALEDISGCADLLQEYLCAFAAPDGMHQGSATF